MFGDDKAGFKYYVDRSNYRILYNISMEMIQETIKDAFPDTYIRSVFIRDELTTAYIFVIKYLDGDYKTFNVKFNQNMTIKDVIAVFRNHLHNKIEDKDSE